MQARGIDQHHALAHQRFEGLAQRLAGGHMGHRHIQNAPQGLELLLGANAKTIHAHQGDILRAVLEHITGCQLGQGGGLAHPRRAYHRNHSAFFQRLQLGGGDHPRQMRQQHPPGLARLFDARHLCQQITGQRPRQADTLQAPPQIGLGRLGVLQLAPGQRAQLYFQQFAQTVEFMTHIVECALIDRRRGRRRGRARWFFKGRLDQRLGSGQRQTGKQLAVISRCGLALPAQAQLGLGRDDPRLGLAQLFFQLNVRHPGCQRGQLVVQGRGQLDAPGDAAVANNGGVSPQLITNQLHGLTHIGGEKSLHLHKPNPQPLGPTVATIVTCLLSGISW